MTVFGNGPPVNMPSDVNGPVDPTSAFNLIGDGTGLTGISNGVAGNQVGTDAQPINPELGPLQDNGGPTFTMAPLANSPALDAGSGETTADADQRGVPRGRVIDLGAYQATASQITVSTSSPAVMGVTQPATVQAFDSFGQPAFDDRDTFSFSSSDPLATINGPATLTAAADTIFATFGTTGLQSLTATDQQTGLSGSQATIQVETPAASVNLASSASPSLYGQAVTITAAVVPNSIGLATPTGTVTLFDGTTRLATLTLVDGVATFTTTALTAGSHTLTAVYGGDANFPGATAAPLTQTVNKAATTNQLAVSPSPATFGQPVTLSATLAVVAPAGGTPGGTVTFRDGSAVIGTARLNASGIATIQTSSLAVGNHTLTAVWFGDSNHIGSDSAPVVETINPISNLTTTTLISSNPNPSTYGQTVTFTALVAGSGGTPTGTVTFLDGTTKIGTGTLVGGQVTFSDAKLTAGSHNITAVYGGDSVFAGSTSTALQEVVSKAHTATTLTVSPSPGTVGAPITLTAVLAALAPGGGIPQGTVTFRDGTTTIGTARLDGTGTATLQVSTLGAGTHNLTAVWFGDSNYVGSTSPVVVESIVDGNAALILRDLLGGAVSKE
jgi:hypothetical protein